MNKGNEPFEEFKEQHRAMYGGPPPSPKVVECESKLRELLKDLTPSERKIALANVCAMLGVTL